MTIRDNKGQYNTIKGQDRHAICNQGLDKHTKRDGDKVNRLFQNKRTGLV